ncbi:MAG: 3-isopropylmalate dehydratase large subunit [Janthinobacterium lividum]
MKSTPQTLYQKLWDEHVVHNFDDGTSLLYIDRHMLNEVSSPQAFEGLRTSARGVWRAASVLGISDHNVPTTGRAAGIADAISRRQVEALDANCDQYGLRQFKLHDVRQGIEHVVGPEQGWSLPGTTLVCGDSHTSTHGALGALAFGIGTSEVEHVLATQTLLQRRAKTMLIRIEGALPLACSAKDVVLSVIGRIGAGGAAGHAIEFAGQAVSQMSMEARMTLCNMSIEAGARCGMVAVDATTLSYLQGRPFAPRGAAWTRAVAHWQTLHSDAGAVFDTVVEIDAATIVPQVTWGTSPDMVSEIDGYVPDPATIADTTQRRAIERALAYMDLAAGMPITAIEIDKVFIGSCTNSRIEDLRAAAAVVRDSGQRVASRVALAMVVPGSTLVKTQAEAEGLDRIFIDAGFEWRDSGCSMCLAMNADRLAPGERCASTSNRNFEGRQGAGGRTHLVSPAMAAAAALAGHFVDVRRLDSRAARHHTGIA